MRFEHYKEVAPVDRSPTLLQDIVVESRARDAAEEAERQSISRHNHKARMEGFRAWVKQQDHLAEDEQAEMIKASFKW